MAKIGLGLMNGNCFRVSILSVEISRSPGGGVLGGSIGGGVGLEKVLSKGGGGLGSIGGGVQCASDVDKSSRENC